MTIEDITRQLSGTLKPTFQNELEELKKVGTQRDSRRPSKKSRNPDEAMGSDGGEMGNPGTISGKGTKGGMVAVSAMAASNINKKRMGTKRDLDVEASRSLKIPLGSLGSDCNDKVVVNLLEPLQLDLLFELKKRAIKEPKEERVKILSVSSVFSLFPNFSGFS
ncbi:hypothetical protein AX774_g3563 [Zancudomyces culisetae]|uniref:Uncharacterized protein n=1 Tax=Zancudomyces culisetae TaxID=1213189 RepID=A0A1R1PPN6_ZANCU|nr:hypothetical protein AX774_g3563 [Zancudomyces culisetae]|eukprot:OMH82945.1 hypothetical protein AX774_g3563 [Zancudomyces culisetae]